jgi:uncharacterized protein
MPSLEHLLDHSDPSLLFECVSGSHLYGTATAESDLDLRGIFAVPTVDYLGLQVPLNQIADARNDIVFYSLRRVIELLSSANPNVLELLYIPEDSVRWRTHAFDCLLERRDEFISQQCVQTHIGYALSQIKKARGQNKWINQPKPELAPAKEDYCHVIPAPDLLPPGKAPCRPTPLSRLGWNLEHFHASRLEHARDGYRLYRYGEEARGVFREGMLVCESIPLEHEASHFAGLLFYNESAWKQALTDHQNYWTWRRERNDARWRQQESGELDYDAKNMMHTLRLLLSGESILQHGCPLVRIEGEQRELLLSIRKGRFSYDELIDMAETIVARCMDKTAMSHLRPVVDTSAADRLLRDITMIWETART